MKNKIFDILIEYQYILLEINIFSYCIYQINENNIAEYKWNFGDGFTSNELNPTHSFQDFGSYEVSLIATDEYGQDSVCLLYKSPSPRD